MPDHQRPTLWLAALAAAALLAVSFPTAVAADPRPNARFQLSEIGIETQYRVGQPAGGWSEGTVFFVVERSDEDRRDSRGQGSSWSVRQVSFAPIWPPQPGVDVIALGPSPRGSTHRGALEVSALYDVALPVFVGEQNPSADDHVIQCGARGPVAGGRPIAASANVCTSAFSRRSASAALLLLNPELALLGPYKMFDSQTLAQAVVATGLVDLRHRLLSRRAEVLEATAQIDGGFRYALNTRLDQIVAAAWPYGTASPPARTLLGQAQDAFRADGWQASDRQIAAWGVARPQQPGELWIANRSDGFVTVRAVSIQIAGTVLTRAAEGQGWLIPPGAEAALSQAPQELAGLIRQVRNLNGSALLPDPRLATGQLAAPSALAGVSILYEAGGRQQTLSRAGPVSLGFAAP
jgi:hypothetical protein